MAIPGVLVCPANESSQGLAVWRVRMPVPKENPKYRQVVRLLVRLSTQFHLEWIPSLQPSRATSLAAQEADVVGISLGPPEMLQKPVIEKPNTTFRELENSGLLCQRAQRS